MSLNTSVGNPRLLCSHALNHVRCMQIYLRLSKSIIMDKRLFKNNIDVIESIDLNNKATYLWSKCSRINSNQCRELQSHNGSYKHHDLPSDDSSLCLSTEMVEISRVEAKVLSLDWRGKWKNIETLTIKVVFIGFLLGLSDLSPSWVWVT